jgi:hypothetical protein
MDRGAVMLIVKMFNSIFLSAASVITSVVLTDKPEGKGSLGRHRRGWEKILNISSGIHGNKIL